MDEALQELIRRARGEPGNEEGWQRCAAALRRAGLPLPADVVDAQRYPPARLPVQRRYHSYGFERLHINRWPDFAVQVELPTVEGLQVSSSYHPRRQAHAPGDRGGSPWVVGLADRLAHP